jgi:Zn-dependent protease
MSLFLREEIRDIVIAVAALTIIFAKFFGFANLFEAFVIVVIAFLLHELAHKFTARKFGAVAHFQIWWMGILIGFITAFFGFIFVAPGAVVVSAYRFGRWPYKVQRLTIREMGIVAASGPAVNIIFSLLFFLLQGKLAGLLVAINAWLAFFNLLPVKPLDGSKIFVWKPWFWFLMLVVAGILVFARHFAFGMG